MIYIQKEGIMPETILHIPLVYNSVNRFFVLYICFYTFLLHTCYIPVTYDKFLSVFNRHFICNKKAQNHDIYVVLSLFWIICR